jgi:hypothetical protein
MPDSVQSLGIRGLDLAAEVKWLPEIDVANRLSGNTVWFKLAVSNRVTITDELSQQPDDKGLICWLVGLGDIAK